MLVQKYVVHDPADASPLLPQHVALEASDGVLLGELTKLPASTTVAATSAAYNELVDRLVALGLATVAAEG